jgi:polysaccharide export outer membrane protein
VSVNITDYRSQPVSIIGWVNKPGVVQLEGRKTLFEVLSLVDGVKPEAGYSVKITRKREYGKIPLPNAVIEDGGRYSVATVNLNSVMEATKPEDNILICPFDVISVPKGELVYVIGDVKKPGGIVLSEQKTITVLQAVSMADGHDKTALLDKTRILRLVPGATTREEIPVDLKALPGDASDIVLR